MSARRTTDPVPAARSGPAGSSLFDRLRQLRKLVFGKDPLEVMRLELHGLNELHGLILADGNTQFLGPYPDVVYPAFLPHRDLWITSTDELRPHRIKRGGMCLIGISEPAGNNA